MSHQMDIHMTLYNESEMLMPLPFKGLEAFHRCWTFVSESASARALCAHRNREDFSAVAPLSLGQLYPRELGTVLAVLT